MSKKEDIDAQDFRDAMSSLGAAVHIITTTGETERCGITASAVCAVTDDPPTLLVCLNRKSSINGAMKANGVLCVNTLAAGHEDISGDFAGVTNKSSEERFSGLSWSELATGAPVLNSALVSFDCEITDIKEVGTHSVIFCAVRAVQHGSGETGLIYYKRAYGTVA